MPQSKPNKGSKNTLMRMKNDAREMNKERIYRELEISERQVREGNERDALAALRQTRKKYGL